MRLLLTHLICLLLALSSAASLAAPATVATPSTLRIGTTHTIRDSGLLDYLMPKFEADTGIKPQLLIAGTGQALRYGAQGDVDVLFTHSPEDEVLLVKAGDGLSRREVMTSDFVIVGPAADPLKLRELADPVAALIRIQQAAHPFVSRGDNSGTHKMEQRLWQRAAVQPAGGWYLAAGQGMAETLRLAEQKQAYVLSERGSFLAAQKRLDLVLLLIPKPPLVNTYAVIPVNPARHPGINPRDAQRFADWLTSAVGQQHIAAYRINGQPVFFPVVAR